MGDELAEVEGHVDAGIGAAERLAVEVDAKRAMQLPVAPALAERFRGHENGRHRARRLRLKKAESLGQFRSEEHTSELQSLMRISYAVFCLKKKTTPTHNTTHKMTKHRTD